jgi:hypothetical protein
MSKEEDIKYLREQIEIKLNGCSPQTIAMFDKLENTIRLDETEKIRSKKVKETTFKNETGMICLAYVIPAAVLDVEEMSEAHKNLVAWYMLGSAMTKGIK